MSRNEFSLVVGASSFGTFVGGLFHLNYGVYAHGIYFVYAAGALALAAVLNFLHSMETTDVNGLSMTRHH